MKWEVKILFFPLVIRNLLKRSDAIPYSISIALTWYVAVKQPHLNTSHGLTLALYQVEFVSTRHLQTHWNCLKWQRLLLRAKLGVYVSGVTSSWCHAVWWKRKGGIFPRGKPDSLKGGSSSSSRVLSAQPGRAGQSAISSPSSRCQHAAGWHPASSACVALQVFVLAKCNASRALQLINMCQDSLQAWSLSLFQN